MCFFFVHTYGVVLIRSLHRLGTFIQRPYLNMFTVCVYLTPGLFFVYYLVFKQAYYFTKHWCDKWSIKYPVRGFELATTWLSVSSHNHQTRAHALSYIFVIFAQFQLLYVRQIHFGVYYCLVQFRLNWLAVWSDVRLKSSQKLSKSDQM